MSKWIIAILIAAVCWVGACKTVPVPRSRRRARKTTTETVRDQTPEAEVAVDAKETAEAPVEADVPTTIAAKHQPALLALADAARNTDDLPAVTVDYPFNESAFPPEIIAPTFLWHDSAETADRWLIDISLPGGDKHIYALTTGAPAPIGPIDERVLVETNEIYQPTPYQAGAQSWRPGDDVWEALKAASIAKAATVTIVGFSATDPRTPLSRGRLSLTTSPDPVGAPIFYRDVPLMPTKNEKGNIKPIPDYALRLVAWRLRDISREDNRAVLTDIPTCANCHSFSLDGRTMGMDIDGPSGDKGAYGLVDLAPTTVVTANDIVTWNTFADKPQGQKTIGFLSRVSPDGQYAVSTVNESIYSAGFSDFRFLQVFYPTRGILAVYSRATGEFTALPGASDTTYVQCDPVWSPDGTWIVFARAKAKDPYTEDQPDPEYADHEDETPLQYDLYRIRFNGGRGGTPERIEGASENGMSNTFPKVSPDGKWIVFVKCRNGQLQRPDSRLWIVPFEGGRARQMNCNMSLMNSWHSFSPNSRWMVFSSKHNTPYTQMFLTHLDEDGNDSPPILIANSTASNRAVNLPEFVNIDYDDLVTIEAPTINYYRHYGQGNEHRRKGRFAEALSEYLLALEAEPTSTRINNNIGVCLVRLGRYAEATKYYHKALELFPDDRRSTMLYCNLGYALAAQDKLDEAQVHYRKALTLDPRNLSAHLNMAQVLAVTDQPDRAIQLALRAVEIDPTSARARYLLGKLYYDTGQIDRAMEHWEATLEIDPEYVVAYSSMGAAVAQLGDTNKAIEIYERALAIDPNHVPARVNLGTVLAGQGQHDEAIRHYRLALEAQPNNIFLLNRLGIALARRGQVDEAIRLFNRALAIDPTHAVSRQNLKTAQAQKANAGGR